MGRPTGSRDGNQNDSAQRRPGLCILLSFQVPDLQIPDSRFQVFKGSKGSKVPVIQVHGWPIVHNIDMVSLKLPMEINIEK
jgi:hypothetical protein